jgi:hypothetical protein
LGRAKEAERLNRRAVAALEAAHGPDHPSVAFMLVGLAYSLHDQGRAAEAVETMQRALAITEAALGPEHPYMASRRRVLELLSPGGR